jgi:FkbM family methyltransferase
MIRVRARNLRDEINLLFMIFGQLIGRHYSKLDMIVQTDGIKFKLIDLESLLIVGPTFEEYVWHYLKPAKGEVFLDIGAHIGKYTLRIADMVGAHGKVVAIEPEPDTFAALQEGIKINGLHNVVALNLAAYDRECDLLLHIVPFGSRAPRDFLVGKGLSSVKRRLSETAIKVQARPLDKIIDALDMRDVNWMKVDAEGAEYEVLRGSKGMLEKYRPKIIAECTTKQTAVFGFLRKLGYAPIHITGAYYFFRPNK